jgi:hypothetical protein
LFALSSLLERVRVRRWLLRDRRQRSGRYVGLTPTLSSGLEREPEGLAPTLSSGLERE